MKKKSKILLLIGLLIAILVILGILASVNRFIAWNKSKKEQDNIKKEN